MTGGRMVGLDAIQSDDELLDRLAARDLAQGGDELEALLGAWVLDIEDHADQVAGTPMPWMGQPRPKLKAIKVHRAAALAGALVVTMSGGMAAAALNAPEVNGARIGVSMGIFDRILPSSPTAMSTTASTTNQVLAARGLSPAVSVGTAARVGTEPAARQSATPSMPATVLPPAVVTTPTSSPSATVSPTSIPVPTATVPSGSTTATSGTGTQTNPLVPEPSSTGSHTSNATASSPVGRPSAGASVTTGGQAASGSIKSSLTDATTSVIGASSPATSIGE